MGNAENVAAHGGACQRLVSSRAAQTWASGYLSSFESWTYAKDAFDKWAAITARRFALLREATPPAQ